MKRIIILVKKKCHLLNCGGFWLLELSNLFFIKYLDYNSD